MDFDSYSGRLVDLNEFCRHYLKPKKIEQKMFQIVNESMQMKSVSKVQFSRLNNKRYYFYNGMMSLPFGHPIIDPLRKEKQKYSTIHRKIQEKKYDFLKEEAQVTESNQRMCVLKRRFTQSSMFYILNSNLFAITRLERLEINKRTNIKQ